DRGPQSSATKRDCILKYDGSMADSEGKPNPIGPRGIHYACTCGERFAARVYETIDAVTQSELTTQLLQGNLNRLRCPKCGHVARAELPVAFHDPRLAILVLVFPEWARARELEERAALLLRLAQEWTPNVPPYARDPFVVYGSAGLSTFL